MKRRWLLPALFVVALALRCVNLAAPLLDAHSWRQADTAAIARNFVALGYQFSLPQVDWGGLTPGYVESEFPLYTGALALLFGAFGPHEGLGRLLSALASAAAPLALYSLVRSQRPADLSQRSVAQYAALALCVLPFAVYFGRTVMPDSLMLLLALLAIWLFQRWLAHPNLARFTLALAAGVLAPLAKTPNLVIVAVPLAYLLLAYRPWRYWPLLALYGVCFALPVLLWTRYAATLPLDPRLSFGIGEKLFDLHLLTDPQFYLLLANWSIWNILTLAGLPFCVIGLAALVLPGSPPVRARYLPIAYLLGVLAFFLVGAAGVVGQDYYLLPLVSPAAWLIGLGIAKVEAWFVVRSLRLARALPVIALVAISALTVLRVAPLYQTADFYRQLGRRVDLALPPGERVGIIAPAVSETLYYGQRKGWRLDPGVLVPGGLASLKPDLGVRYVLIADPWLSEQRVLLTEEMRAYRRVAVGPYALMLDLEQPGYAEPFELVWQTGHVIAGPFLAEWQRLGGLNALGYPLSDALPFEAGQVQYFERALLAAQGEQVVLAPAGRELLELRGGSPRPAPVEGMFAEAWARLGGRAVLGEAVSGVLNEHNRRVQYFENGVLEEQTDGSVALGAVGRWLLDARGLTEEQQIVEVSVQS